MMPLRPSVVLAWTCALICLVPSRSSANPGQTYSDAYWAAVSYLEAHVPSAIGDDEFGAILAAEAIRAHPSVLGPRSTALLGSLELKSLDARARRVRALRPGGLATVALDVASDVSALVAELALSRPNPIALNASHRQSSASRVGHEGRRVPIEIDNALALRGLYAAGIDTSSPHSSTIQDALVYLLEFQLTDGSWPLVRGGEAAGGGAVGDVAVTAEAVRALTPYHDLSFSIHVPPELGINLDVGAAVEDGVSYLGSAAYTNAADRALSLLALVEWRLERGVHSALDAAITAAHAELLGPPFRETDGSFDHSVFATALAAQALLQAASLPDFAFDNDGDGAADGPDPDADDDGFCDPGESGPSCGGVDAFPFDPNEDSDLDNDGVGDAGDPDRDGDGVKDSDPNESPFSGEAQESADSDGDGLGDVFDLDDDDDGVDDVEEGLRGLDPRDPDTDGDTFRDAAEVAADTDGTNPGEFPAPDGDIYPLGSSDGIVDIRDALLALQVLGGQVVVSGQDQVVFDRHGDVAPQDGGAPDPDGVFSAGDAMLIVRRATGQSSW